MSAVIPVSDSAVLDRITERLTSRLKEELRSEVCILTYFWIWPDLMLPALDWRYVLHSSPGDERGASSFAEKGVRESQDGSVPGS